MATEWKAPWERDEEEADGWAPPWEQEPAKIAPNPVRDKLLAERDRLGGRLGGLGADAVQESVYTDEEREDRGALGTVLDKALTLNAANPWIAAADFASNLVKPDSNAGDAYARSLAKATLGGAGATARGIADLGRGVGDVGAYMVDPGTMFGADDVDLPREAFAARPEGRGAPVTRGGAGGWLEGVAGGLEGLGRRGTASETLSRGESTLGRLEKGGWKDVVPGLLRNPAALGALAGSGVGSTASTMAAGAMTPGLGIAPMFFQELSGIEEQQRAHEEETGKRINPLERLGRQVGTAGAIAALEKIVPDELRKASKYGGKGYARALALPFKEGGTEAAQRGLADFFATEAGELNPSGMMIEGLAGAVTGGALAPIHMGPKADPDKVVTDRRDLGRDVLNHTKNVRAFKEATAKKAAIDEFQGKTATLEKLQSQLQETVNLAAASGSPRDKAAAADLKGQVDLLSQELGGAQAPAPLSREDELWIQRGRPKLGDALGGGRGFGRANPDVDTQRLGATPDEIGETLKRWAEDDPVIRNSPVIVHGDAADPGFWDHLQEADRAAYLRAVQQGATPEQASSRIAVPGLFSLEDGKIHVLAPRLMSWDHLDELIRHESTHDAVREAKEAGERGETAVPLFGKSGPERTMAALAARAKGKDFLGAAVRDAYPKASTEELADEVLAVAQEFGKTRGKASTADRIVAKFRDTLRANLPAPLRSFVEEASDAEIRVMLERARGLVAGRTSGGGVAVGGKRTATPTAQPEAASLDEIGKQIASMVAEYERYLAPILESEEANTPLPEPKRAAPAPPRPPRPDVDAMLEEQRRNDEARAEAQRKADEEYEAAKAREAAAAEASAKAERAPLDTARVSDEQRRRDVEQAERDAKVRLQREREAAQQREVVGGFPVAGADVLSSIAERGAVSPKPQERVPEPVAPIPVDQLIARTEEKNTKKATGKAPSPTPPPSVPPVAGPTTTTAPPGKAPKKKARHSIRTRFGYEERDRALDDYSLPDEKRRATENPEHWVRYAVPATASFPSDSAITSAKTTLRQFGIALDQTTPLEGVGKNGVWTKPTQAGNEVIITTWPDGRPAYAWSLNGKTVAWAAKFPGGKTAARPSAETKTEKLARLLEQTDPLHPFRVMQGELAKRGVMRDPTTDALSEGGLATAELMAPADSFVKKFRRWAIDPRPIIGRVRYEHGDHTALTEDQIRTGLEQLRRGYFGMPEAHAVNMLALDEERKELERYNRGGKIRTAEEAFRGADEARRVVGQTGAAGQAPEGLGRAGVPGAGEGLVTGTPERGEAGRAGGGELPTARADASVEERPFPEAEEPLPPFKARYSMAGASAKTADRKELARAQRMVRGGISDEETWKQTGWRRFPDGRWRFEISDHDASLNEDAYKAIPFDFKIGVPQVTLGELVNHPALFDAYPGLRNLRVVRASRDDGGTVAAIDKRAGKILLYSRIDREPEGPLSFILHETQHAIQDTEGFAKGGSPDTVSRSVPEAEARQYAEQEAQSLERSAEELDADAASLETRAILYAPISTELEEIRRTMFSEFSRRDERIARTLERARATLGDELSPAQMDRLVSDVRNGRSPESLRERANEIRRRAIAMREDAEGARSATGPALQRYVDKHADTHEFYRRLAGEAEARQTQARQKLTPEERRARDPYLDFDVEPDRQLVDRTRYSVRGEPVVGEDGVRRLTIFHMSNREGLEEVDPRFQGTGQAGAEMKRRYDDGFEPFSNWYTGEPGTVVEAHRFGGKPMYESEVELTNEPGGVIEAGRVDGRTMAQLKEAGFTGVYFPQAGQVQMLAPVRPRPVGTAPRAVRPVARGDEFYREATGREARYSRRQEGTPEFKLWFGDSKVVDERGRPRVVYHGVSVPFEGGAFDMRKKASDFGDTELGFFFTAKPEVASAFAGDGPGASLIPVYLAIGKPYQISGERFYEMLDGGSALSARQFRALRRQLEKSGYDGIMVGPSEAIGARRGWDQFKAETYIAFRPEQIKSATGNTGAFDPRNPDIRYSRRDPSEAQISWEAVPSTKIDWLRGVHEAPYNVRAAFTTDLDNRVFRDKDGRDILAPLFGLREVDQISAPGYWEGKQNPSRQLFLEIPLGPDGAKALADYAAARGYILRQDAVGVHTTRNPGEGEAHNGLFLDMGRTPTPDEYAAYMEGLAEAAGPGGMDNWVAVPTVGGINLWTFEPSPTPQRIMEVSDGAASKMGDNIAATAYPIVVDSDLVANDWAGKEANGEGYLQRITAAGRSPGLQGRIDQLRKAADRAADEWARKQGWGAYRPADVTPVDAPIPGDLESFVGRDVKSKGKSRENLFQQIANVISGKDLREMRAAAEAGRAMKGWYRDSVVAIRKLFGDDTETFVALLAALSPRQGVAENLRMAVNVWVEWDRRGRPTDPAEIEKMFPRIGTTVDEETGRLREKHALVDMGGRIPNTVTALAGLGTKPLSGPKVESFRRNLLGDFDAVANDTWMAQFSDISQAIFGKPAGYLAGSYLVRKVAKQLGWTPAEVQETVWTFFRELRARTDSPLHRTQSGHRPTTARDQALAMTNADVISGADSFAHLVRDPDVRKKLERLGIDVSHLEEPVRLGDDATYLAVRPKDRDSRVLGRVVERVQRAHDRAWASKQLATNRLHRLPDADPVVLRDIAEILGVPVRGRSGPQIARALQTYRDPVRYSRRSAVPLDFTRSAGPASIPLDAPQVESRVDKLAEGEGYLLHQGADYTPTPLKRDTVQPQDDVEQKSRRLDMAITDDKWVSLVNRKDRVLSATEQMAINARVALREVEMNDATTRRVEAERMSEDERKAKGLDVQALIREEIEATLGYVAMQKASINAGTEAGRALAARKRIMAAGTELTPDMLTRKLLKEIPNASSKDVADLFQKYRTGDMAAFREGVRDAMAPGWARKYMEYFRGAGLLSGIGTHVANFTGNIGEPAFRLAETMYAAGADKVYSTLTGRPRERFLGEAKYELQGQLAAIPAAFGKFTSALYHQILLQEEPDVEMSGKFDHQVGAISGRKGTLIRTSFRALGVADDFFKELGFAAALQKRAYREARREGLTGTAAEKRALEIANEGSMDPTGRWRSLMEAVAKERLERVFQEDPAKAIQSVMRITHDHPLLGLIVPFVKTPANITRAGWRRSPMGLLLPGDFWTKSRKYAAQQEALRAGKKVDGELVSRGEVEDSLARASVGTTLAVAFGALAAAGLMTGGGPTDDDEKKAKRATGWQPYSFVIPGAGTDGKPLYIPYGRFEPASSLMGIVADAFELSDERNLLDKVLTSVATNWTNKTFFKGLNDAAQAIYRPQIAAKNWLGSTVAAHIPNIVAKGAEALDPTFRDRRSPSGLTGLGEFTKRGVLRRIPGASNTLEPMYSVTGEESPRPGNAFTRFVLPIQASSERPGTELEAYMAKIHEVPADVPRELVIPKALLPRDGERDWTGTRIHVTDAERAFLAKARRDAASQLRRQLTSLQRLPIDTQRKRIRDTFRDAQERAIKQLWARSQELRERAREKVTQ